METIREGEFSLEERRDELKKETKKLANFLITSKLYI